MDSWFTVDKFSDNKELIFDPEKIDDPALIAQVISWFLLRVQYVVDPSDVNDMYVSDDNNELVLHERINDYDGCFKRTEKWIVPFEVIFSESNIYEWVRNENIRKRAEEASRLEAKRAKDMEKQDAEEQREYKRLRKKFGEVK